MSFMAVTVHYLIESDMGALELRSRLVAFRSMPVGHTGKELATEFVSILEETGGLFNVRFASSWCSPYEI